MFVIDVISITSLKRIGDMIIIAGLFVDDVITRIIAQLTLEIRKKDFIATIAKTRAG